eukprot:RCo013421
MEHPVEAAASAPAHSGLVRVPPNYVEDWWWSDPVEQHRETLHQLDLQLKEELEASAFCSGPVAELLRGKTSKHSSLGPVEDTPPCPAAEVLQAANCTCAPDVPEEAIGLLNQELRREYESSRRPGQEGSYKFPFEPEPPKLEIRLPTTGVSQKDAEASQSAEEAAPLTVLFRVAALEQPRGAPPSLRSTFPGLQYLARVRPVSSSSSASGAAEALLAKAAEVEAALTPQPLSPPPSREGSKLPWATFTVLEESGASQELSTRQLFGIHRHIIVSSPGPFTPTSSDAHLPRFNDLFGRLQDLGVHSIGVPVVCDARTAAQWQ